MNFENWFNNFSVQSTITELDQETLDGVLGSGEMDPPDCGNASAREHGRRGEDRPSVGSGNRPSRSGAVGEGSGWGISPAAQAGSQPQAKTSSPIPGNSQTYRAAFVKSEARKREVEQENEALKRMLKEKEDQEAADEEQKKIGFEGRRRPKIMTSPTMKLQKQ